MKFILTLLSLSLLWVGAKAQSGCTDPQALNYDAIATMNDGSCAYGLTEYVLTEIVQLPNSIKECSGVELIDSGLWTHNDAGNEDKIYRIDSLSGEVLQSVIVATGDNIDWEDIAEDEDHIYIGDFGNNLGNRMDLRIYKINKVDMVDNVVNAELIEFSYSDQTDFTENNNDNDFDCEAFLFYNDSLHLFTKNWVDNQTKHYVLPATPGNHSAEYVESFNVTGLITGADISENGEIALIGYTEFGVNFMWLVFDYTDHLFFSGNKRKISLGLATGNGQTEGITFRGDGYGYICSEEFSFAGQVLATQKLLSFSIKEWVDNITGIDELDESYGILAYPNPFDDFINLELSKPVDLWRLYDSNGRLIRSAKTTANDLFIAINSSDLSPGAYYFEMAKEGKSKTVKLMKLLK